MGAYVNPIYPYKSPADLMSTPPQRKPLIVIGAGPVGLAAAIDARLQGLEVLVLDDDKTVSVGSRAVCYAKRSLEILDRLGIADEACGLGVSWNIGRTFLEEDEVYQFNLVPDAGHKRPGMINLQQYHVEEMLIARALELGADIRWQHKVTAVDAKAGVIKFDVQEDVKAQVLNVLPSMRAGAIAVQTGLNNLGSNRWCGVNYLNFESTVAKDVHVLGDSIQIAPGMPKSGHMANSHGKVAAAAIVAELAGWPINPAPMLTNTCYSFIDPKMALHVASVHEYVAAEKTFKTVAGSGGVSTGPTELEGVYALSWASNIWADTLA